MATVIIIGLSVLVIALVYAVRDARRSYPNKTTRKRKK